MRIYPAPLDIRDDEGFTPEKDLFGRAELGKGMSHLVATVDDPLVIAFDGQWGSGKTTFLKMWAGELRKNGHPVIFFDAFENDYVEDAFAALAREIVALAEEHKSTKAELVETFREKTSQLGVLLLKGALKVGAKAAVRVATAGVLKSEDFKEVAEDLASEAEDAAAAYMDQLLDQPRRQKEVVTAFREALSNLPALLAPPVEGEKQKPLIFIIDELDRCKPLFALALLERIKHFMAVPNVHFVLGVYMEQLEGSVRYAYGSDIKAASYLQKFINLSILCIENAESDDRNDLHKYACFLTKRLNVRRNNESPVSSSIDTIVRIIQFEKMSFRTLERAFTVLALAIGLTPENRLQLGAIMGGLIMMKMLRPDLFRKAKIGTLTLSEVKAFLRFSPKIEAQSEEMSWEEKWWTYLLSENLTKELEDYGRSALSRYSIRQRRDVVKHTANAVIDRIAPN